MMQELGLSDADEEEDDLSDVLLAPASAQGLPLPLGGGKAEDDSDWDDSLPDTSPRPPTFSTFKVSFRFFSHIFW